MNKKYTVLILVIVLVVTSFCPIAGLLSLRWSEKSLKTKIHANYVPHPFFPVYSLRGVSFEWEDKLTVSGGILKVQYNPFQWLTERQMRFRITGRGIPVNLGPSLSQTGQAQKTTLSEFYADILLGPDGIKDIYAIKVKSPEIQLAFGPNA